MKKKLAGIVLFLFSFQLAFSQESEDILGGKTLEDIKQDIKAWIEYYPEYINKIDPLDRFADDKKFDEVEIYSIEDVVSMYSAKPYKLLSREKIAEGIQSSLKSMQFYQRVNVSESTIDLYESWWQTSLLEDLNSYFPIRHDSLIAKKVFYKNGSTEVLNKGINWKIPNRKLIDSIEVETNAYYPLTLKKAVLSAKTPVAYLGKDTIKIQHVGSRLLLFQISSNDAQLLSVLGKTADGRLLQAEDYSQSELDLEQYKKQLYKEMNFFKQLLVQLENNEIADVNTFMSIMEKQREADEKALANENKVYRFGYQYPYPVESFELYYIDNFEKHPVKAVITSGNDSKSTDFFVASDGEHYGLIDMDGNWLVEPAYHFLSYQEDNFFTCWDEERNTVTMRYDPKKKEFKKENFTYNQKIAKDRYHVTLDDKNMVVNAASQIIIPPTQFYDIEYHEGANKFIARDGVGYSLYDYNGTLLLPDKYQSIYIDQNNFVQLTPLQKSVIYDLQMKKLSKDSWQYVEACGENTGLLYVRNINQESFFVNLKGEVVIEPNIDYEFDKSYSYTYFENGFCTVRSADYQYGCIDTKGNLIVPTEYTMLFTLGKNYICGSKDGQTVFIDKSGRIVKTLSSGLYSYEYPEETGMPFKFILENGEVYDENGNFVRQDSLSESEDEGEGESVE